MIWNETKECMSRDEMAHMQSARLKKLVNRVYHDVEFYRKKMQEIGLEPGDIRGIEDLNKLPFTTKEDLRDNYPFGMFALPVSEVVRIHASSGTTGKATVVGYTRRDLEIWQECVARVLTMVGIGKQDKIQVSYGYGLFTGGLGLHYGGENVGATVIPMSTGNTKKQITMMRDFGVTAIACTPSYLLHIIESLEENNLADKTNLKYAILGGEPWTDNMRKEIEKRLGIKAYNIYGMSEIIGPGVSADCQYHQGLHIYEDHFVPEIINPDSLEQLEEGESGELVFTTLTKEALPLLRYRTRDITSLTYQPCECGRNLVRMGRLEGRTDDMLIIRGVNIFPSQVETALLEIDEISPHYQLIADRVNNLDILEVRVELNGNFFSDEIGEIEKLRKRITHHLTQALGVSVIVKLVEPKTLGRSEGKSERVIDNRKLL
ncbi:MAG: phenylacetate--CoA ligase [Clostridiales bacterium]|nr:phenylacetate--CoA ligase [Clostridiales bacterium]